MKGLLSLCNVPLQKNISLFISKLVGFFSKLCFSCSHRNRFVINRQCNNIIILYYIIEFLFLYFAIVIPCSFCHSEKKCWVLLIWVTGHCNRAAVSRNRYGVEKTVDTHKILINAIKFYVCLQEI
jgi:hypothetical protein